MPAIQWHRRRKSQVGVTQVVVMLIARQRQVFILVLGKQRKHWISDNHWWDQDWECLRCKTRAEALHEQPTHTHTFEATAIRKYGITFYVEMGQVQNGCLYLRYGNSSAKSDKTLTDKRPLLFYCKSAAPKLLLYNVYIYIYIWLPRKSSSYSCLTITHNTQQATGKHMA